MSTMINLENVCPHDKKLITALAAEGLSAGAIGNKFSFSAQKVVAVCKEAGVFVKTARERTPNLQEKMVNLIMQGKLSQQAIADMLRVCPSRVRKMQAELLEFECGKAREFWRSKMAAKYRKVSALTNDGMTIGEACKVVGGISTATYTRYKSAEKKASMVS